MTTFADRLLSKLSPVETMDRGWVRYVKDHREIILASATTERVPLGAMHFNRFRMKTLLQELGVGMNLAWIVMWINQIDSMRDVKDIEELVVPNLETINRLRDQYDTYSAKITELQA